VFAARNLEECHCSGYTQAILSFGRWCLSNDSGDIWRIFLSTGWSDL